MADDFETKNPFILTRIESYYHFIKNVMDGNYKNLPIDYSVDEIDKTYVKLEDDENYSCSYDDTDGSDESDEIDEIDETNEIDETDETDDSDSCADNASNNYYHDDQASSSRSSRINKFNLADTIFRFGSCMKPYH